MPLPRKVKIWGHDYVIKTMHDPHYLGEAVMGLFKPNDQEIVLSRKYLKKKPVREVEVLLHEIMHGICHNSKMFEVVHDEKERDRLEEHVVGLMANGVVAIMKDNPELIDFFKENING